MTSIVMIDRMLLHPVRAVPLAFLVVALLGTGLLMLPQAAASGEPTAFIDALFTAVSALCVTGLVTLDTGTHWSTFGQSVILGLIQLGGLGLMLVATLLLGLFAGALPIAQRRLAGAEVAGLGAIGDVRGATRLILVVAIVVELAVALVLLLRFAISYDQPLPEAAWNAVFHAVSAYNNAGFGLYPDSMMRFAADPLILVPLASALILGGLGFPVLWDLLHRIRAKGGHRWSLHSRLTIWSSLVCLVLGAAAMLAFESGGVMQAQSWPVQLLNALFHSASLRTAGFNAVDMASQSDAMLIVSSALMLIGGGVAGTAGGIKLTTAALLGLIVLAELRGQADVTAFGRRVGTAVQRRAITIILVAIGLLVSSVLLLSVMTDLPTRDIAFEAVSAFATVGLSTGITAQLPDGGLWVIIMLMFIGRVGPITLGAALLLRHRPAAYRYPMEDPLVG